MHAKGAAAYMDGAKHERDDGCGVMTGRAIGRDVMH